MYSVEMVAYLQVTIFNNINTILAQPNRTSYVLTVNELTEGMSYTITATATNRIGRSVPIESEFIVSCKELI